MINKQEIRDHSQEFGLSIQVIEKDYVLGWLIKGIFENKDFYENWVFKGGTCLKKCFFETYRFSEDLDFTIIAKEQLSADFLKPRFKKISEWIYDQSGIELPVEGMTFESYQNPRGKPSIEGKIGYIGPLQFRRKSSALPKIKLDLSADELLCSPATQQRVFHPYTDEPNGGIIARSYSFEEIFAEKVRALYERLRPRDLYDVIHLFRHDELKPDLKIINEILKKKCEFKNISLPSMEALENHSQRELIETGWSQSLRHQLASLPPFKDFWSELGIFFAWLYKGTEKTSLPLIPTRKDIDPSWVLPSRPQLWGSNIHLEKIRFAAANRICVELDYINKEGERSTRVIEPYSLRRSREENFLLFAVRRQDGKDRSYRMDRIQGVKISDQSFIPRYTVELSVSRRVSAPEIERPSHSD